MVSLLKNRKLSVYWHHVLEGDNDTLVHGPQGKIIKARTVNQRKMVKESQKNDMLFAVGPAGTGKTYTAVAIAVRALKIKKSEE